MARATLWSGQLSDEVYCKLVSIMECVHNLDGNYDESEALQVAKVLQDFTINDLDEIDQLNIDIHDDDDLEPAGYSDDPEQQRYVSARERQQADEIISMLTDGIGRGNQ